MENYIAQNYFDVALAVVSSSAFAGWVALGMVLDCFVAYSDLTTISI